MWALLQASIEAARAPAVQLAAQWAPAQRCRTAQAVARVTVETASRPLAAESTCSAATCSSRARTEKAEVRKVGKILRRFRASCGERA